MGIDAPQGNTCGRAGGLGPLSIRLKVRKTVLSLAQSAFGQSAQCTSAPSASKPSCSAVPEMSSSFSVTERLSSACSVFLGLAFHISRNICCWFSLYASTPTLISLASWRAHVAVTSWVFCVLTECSLNTAVSVTTIPTNIAMPLLSEDVTRHVKQKAKACAVKDMEPSVPH